MAAPPAGRPWQPGAVPAPASALPARRAWLPPGLPATARPGLPGPGTPPPAGWRNTANGI